MTDDMRPLIQLLIAMASGSEEETEEKLLAGLPSGEVESHPPDEAERPGRGFSEWLPRPGGPALLLYYDEAGNLARRRLDDEETDEHAV